jgi:hypothetical protein
MTAGALAASLARLEMLLDRALGPQQPNLPLQIASLKDGGVPQAGGRAARMHYRHPPAIGARPGLCLVGCSSSRMAQDHRQ